MDHQFSPRRLRLATTAIAFSGAALLGLASSAGARVTEIDITTAPNTTPAMSVAIPRNP